MSLKPKIALTVRILLVLTVFVVGLGVGFYYFLPRYLESRIIPQLVTETGISDFAFKVRHIGIYGEVPKQVAADGCYASAKNLDEAKLLGIKT